MDSIYGTQPFEELANQEREPTSPTSLEDFYREQERIDLERKRSRRSLRRRRGRSKSLASSSDIQSPVNEDPPLLSPRQSGLPSVQEAGSRTNTPPRGSPQPSLRANGTGGENTPEPVQWHEPNREYFPPEPTLKTKYELYNPIVPPVPWTNHHLRQPGAPWPPTSQPRKVFNPHNMASTTALIHRRDAGGGNASGNSSSSSFPKTTPNSNMPPAVYGPDHVDFLDPSDPWGMRWHHDSRYDVGDFTSSTRGNPSATWAGTSSPLVELPNGRGGSPSGLNVRPGMKAPSPLSQSTSAVQMQPQKNVSSISLDTPKQLSRRLSKRNSRTLHPSSQSITPSLEAPNGVTKRTSGFRSLFSSSQSAPQIDRKRSKTLGSTSAPPTTYGFPSGVSGSSARTPSETGRPPSKNLTAPPSAGQSSRSSLTPSPTKDPNGKRTSYLGRLVKKFSIIRHSDADATTPPNSAGGIKRSVSTANGIYGERGSSKPDLHTGMIGHPKFASAPETSSPISMVPELRLVGVDEHPSIGQPVRHDEDALNMAKSTRPQSEGRNSPDSVLPGLRQFGGLVIANPDARASSASEIEPDGEETLRKRRAAAERQQALSSSSDLDLSSQPPKPAFMRGAGAGGRGVGGSADSSPTTDFSPLRVVNGQAGENASETGTIGAREIPSPASTVNALPTSTSATPSAYGSHLVLSAIPSIPDLPSLSPFNPTKSIATDSPRSSNMETALEFMSPPTSTLSVNKLASSARRTSPDVNKERTPPENSTKSSTGRSDQSSRPLSTHSSATTGKASTVASSASTSKDTSASGGTTVRMLSGGSPNSEDLPLPLPLPRRRAPSTGASGASVAESGSGSGGSRFAAYYSPGAFPSFSLPPGTPQTQSQRYSVLSVEENPLPTPPARLPIPLLSENPSRERLRSLGGSKEKVAPSEREPTKEKAKETSKESKRTSIPAVVTSRSIVDLSIPSPTTAVPPTRVKESRAENGTPPSTSNRSTPTQRGSRDTELIKEKRNQSTFRIPGESSDSRPSSRDLPSSSSRNLHSSSSRDLHSSSSRDLHSSSSRDLPSSSASVMSVSTVSSVGVSTVLASHERTRTRSKEGLNNVLAPSSTRQRAESGSSRSRTESGNYDVTATRPRPAQHSSYSSSKDRDSSDPDVDSGSMRKRAISSAAQDARNGASTGTGSREEARRRANSTKSPTPAVASARAATMDSYASSNGRSSSRGESKQRQDSKQEDPAKLVLSGEGQSWEVVEAVMIQPSRSGSASAKRSSASKEPSNGTSANSRQSSTGTSFPARTTSRSGYNANGEPISLASPTSPRSFTTPRRGPTPPIKDTAPPAPSSKDQERLARREKERSKTMDPERSTSSSAPAIPARSKSRPREQAAPSVNLNKPQPPRPPPTPAPAQPQPLPNGSSEYPRRRDSLQRTRPTSEVVNNAELAAHEVWEHDRMTARGQSVLLPDGFSLSPPTSHRTSASSSLLLQGNQGNSPVPSAGSAHTVFKVQAPFQARHTPPSGYYYPNHQPLPNPLPAPPASILPPKTSRNRI